MQDDPVRHVIEAVSFSTIIASVVGWLPAIASLLAIIWYLIVIWESDTMRRWTGRGSPVTHIQLEEKHHE